MHLTHNTILPSFKDIYDTVWEIVALLCVYFLSLSYVVQLILVPPPHHVTDDGKSGRLLKHP